MAIYMGSGFRCQVSMACSFRVFPSSGSDDHLNEAARIRATHQKTCSFTDAPLPVPPPVRPTFDDRRTQLASAALEIAEDEKPQRNNRGFTCTCKVCGDRFVATGPRASFCPKRSCQAKRLIPLREQRAGAS